MLSATFAEVQKLLREERVLGEKVMLVSVTVDPLHDTPEALRAYGQRYGADFAGWRFVTGDWDRVFDVVAGFKVGVRSPRPPADTPPPGGNEITHSNRIVLVDQQGRVRAYLRGDEASPREVARTARSLL